MLDTIAERPACSFDQRRDLDLFPWLAELLEDAPQVMLDFLTEDLRRYEQTGYASATISRLLQRALCLAEADRLERKFAA